MSMYSGVRPLSESERLARRSDPATSHEAAEAIVASTSTIRARVLEIIRSKPEGLTHDGVFEAYVALYGGVRESTIRTRVSELVDGRLARDTGQRQRTRSGRQAIVWGLA